jgi:hypothetical protein
MAAGGLVLFVLKQKGPKNSSQQKCFFAALAFALQNDQNLGWNYLPLCFAAQAVPSGKTSYALPPHRPPSFCPFSPEASSADTLGRTMACAIYDKIGFKYLRVLVENAEVSR